MWLSHTLDRHLNCSKHFNLFPFSVTWDEQNYSDRTLEQSTAKWNLWKNLSALSLIATIPVWARLAWKRCKHSHNVDFWRKSTQQVKAWKETEVAFRESSEKALRCFWRKKFRWNRRATLLRSFQILLYKSFVTNLWPLVEFIYKSNKNSNRQCWSDNLGELPEERVLMQIKGRVEFALKK